MNWRNHLTPEESKAIDTIDKLKAKWQKANKDRHTIQNRAIQRAKKAQGKKSHSKPLDGSAPIT